jgi:putative peptidoglycan lipid II flippase
MVSGFVLVAMLTVGSKAMSFVKDAAVARQFGTGDALDAFMLAFGFLTFLAALIGGGLPEAFLPLYAEAKHHQNIQQAHKLAVQSSLLQALSLALVGLAVWLLAPAYVSWTTHGFSPEKQALAVVLLRQLIPFLLCFGLSYQFGTWLRADKHFLLATSAPMLVPLTIIGFLVFDGSATTVQTLVLGTVVGAGLHLLVLCIGL